MLERHHFALCVLVFSALTFLGCGEDASEEQGPVLLEDSTAPFTGIWKTTAIYGTETRKDIRVAIFSNGVNEVTLKDSWILSRRGSQMAPCVIRGSVVGGEIDFDGNVCENVRIDGSGRITATGKLEFEFLVDGSVTYEDWEGNVQRAEVDGTFRVSGSERSVMVTDAATKPFVGLWRLERSGIKRWPTTPDLQELRTRTHFVPIVSSGEGKLTVLNMFPEEGYDSCEAKADVSDDRFTFERVDCEAGEGAYTYDSRLEGSGFLLNGRLEISTTVDVDATDADGLYRFGYDLNYKGSLY